MYFPVQKCCKQANYSNERKIESRLFAPNGVHTSTITAVWREEGRRRVEQEVIQHRVESLQSNGLS